MHHSFVLRHISRCHNSLFFFFNDTATTEIYTLSLHDALPISSRDPPRTLRGPCHGGAAGGEGRWRRAEASYRDLRGGRGRRHGLDPVEHGGQDVLQERSEERRVGKEGRSRWSPYH